MPRLLLDLHGSRASRTSKVLHLAALVAVVAISCARNASIDAPSPPAPSEDDGGSVVENDAGTSAKKDGGTPANPNVVRFVAVGDTGTGTNNQQKVANGIASVCEARGCDFIQLLGDNLYETGATSVDDPVWEAAFEGPYRAIDLDFWVILGNHDYGANGAGTEFDKGQHEVDYSAHSPKWKLPSAYWHKVAPNGNRLVEVFGLDTNMILFDKAADQKKDIPAWIAASKAEWKIAVGHHPYKSNGPHGNAGRYDGASTSPRNGANVKAFLENNVCGKVDLYICGHDHSRQWLSETCNGTELAVSGGGAKSTDLGGKNATLFESLGLGFLYVVIDGKTLTAEFVDEDGKTEFSHTIEKP